MHKNILFLLSFYVVIVELYQIPLFRRPSKRLNRLKQDSWSSYLQNKTSRFHSFRPKNKLIYQNIRDFEDVEYVVRIHVGTPGQPFDVILDTGSANLWVPDIECDKCWQKRRFDSSQSVSYRPTRRGWSLTYGDGTNATGIFGVDTVILGDGADQLIIPHQTFGQAIDENVLMASDPTFDGILGLGFGSLAKYGATPPLIHAMNQGIIQDALFTVYLQAKGPYDNTPGGYVTYGDIDRTHCGPVIAFNTLTSDSFFQFKLEAVQFGNVHNSQGWQAISDTGSSLIVGPPRVVRRIAREAGAYYSELDQSYFVDCYANLPSIKFTIDGIAYSVDSDHLIIQTGDGRCLFAISENPAGESIAETNSWNLGDPFIRQYCNIYDLGNKRIGFAKALQS